MILEISLFSVFNILAAVIYAAIEEYRKSEEDDDSDGTTQQGPVPRNQLFSVNRIPSLSVADTINVYVIPVTHFRGEPSEDIIELGHSLVDSSRSVGVILIPESDSSSDDSSDESDEVVTEYGFIEEMNDNCRVIDQITESVESHSSNVHIGEGVRDNFMLWRRAANALQNRTGGLHRVATEVMELREIVTMSDSNIRSAENPDDNVV